MKYEVIAYRWANKNAHKYEVGCFGDLDTAIEAAEQETNYRAGRYSCVVYHHNEAVYVTEIPEHYKLGMKGMNDYSYYINSLSIYVGVKNAEHIIKEWVFESCKTPLSGIEYVKEKLKFFIDKNLREYLDQRHDKL